MKYTVIIYDGFKGTHESVQLDTDKELEELLIGDIVEVMAENPDLDEEEQQQRLFDGEGDIEGLCWMDGFVEVNFP